jgi:hypothetical protein
MRSSLDKLVAVYQQPGQSQWCHAHAKAVDDLKLSLEDHKRLVQKEFEPIKRKLIKIGAIATLVMAIPATISASITVYKFLHDQQPPAHQTAPRP